MKASGGRLGWLLFLSLLVSPMAGAGDLPEITLRVDGTPLPAEVAATADSRTTGLSGRDRLGPNRGMLFVWNRSARRRFWMKGTRIPLSIAFLDKRGRIINIHRMPPPPSGRPQDGYRRYPSHGPARFALEVNRGWFSAHGIEAGSRCHFRLPAGIAGSEVVVGNPKQP
ncbi:DUF192 domain-containing protein [Thiohalorhabdus sp.]|uniref:DUF192 domain-containing protein n=1 Tax=Thiohalorhabdus sp. TaxID=3094134 RepID=UPI002FC3DDE0